MIPSPPKGMTFSDERGSALVSALLILLLLTVLASGGFWLSSGEMAAAQGYSQSVRALYVAEAGLARYFASSPKPQADTMAFVYYADPCDDTIAYPNPAAEAECRADEDGEAEDLLEHFELSPPPSAVYDFTNANVYVTARFVVSDGKSPIYEITAEARVQDRRNPNLWTMRAIDHYAELLPPFSINSVFTSKGGIDFGGDNNDHYHFDGGAKSGKSGKCGSETDLVDNMQVPSGQWDLPLPDGDCPAGKGCPYKWHQKGNGLDVDSAQATGSGIVGEMGLDWSDFLNDSYYTGLSDVETFNDSDDFEDFFHKSKDKAFKAASSWPITRFSGDLTVDKDVKGYGVLIITGDLTVEDKTFEWTGVILSGGVMISEDGSHYHVKGAAVAGLSCTDAEIAAGLCRSVLDGDHTEMKYRPCEISQAWSQLMFLQPLVDLFRESGPNS